MRKIFFLPLLLLCFISCSNNKENEPEKPDQNPEPTFKVSKITDGYTEINFSYDNQGKISNYEYLEGSDYNHDYWNINYTYAKDKITSSGYIEKTSANGVYNLDANNRVTNAKLSSVDGYFENAFFTYNSDGYLTSMSVTDNEGFTDKYQFEISNGNISRISYENNYHKNDWFSVEISYSNIENKAEIYFWDLGFLPNDIFYNYPALMLQGYLGKATKNLPSIATTTGGFTGIISKVLTNDGGAVTSFTISAKDGDNDAEIFNYVVSYK